ncbi:MAG: UDP-N-acetylmuramate--L-alanine ligase [Candidatus Eisenbacteria bacterium]
MFGKVKHIHLVGIGGTGMSGIAELLLNLGYKVSGTDLATTDVTQRLTELGGHVIKGHSAAEVEGADVVVYSSAIKRDNVEIIEAHRCGIPVIPRAEMLAELMRMKQGIAVGGAHGKTTTTWLVGLVMAAAGLDPTIIVGGRLKAIGTNAKLGGGPYLVAEADESDGSFLRLSPNVAVVTTVDEEHLDYYNDIEAIKASFVEFANKVPFYGAAVVCLDEENVQAIIPRIIRRVITYGFSQQADVRATDVVLDGQKVTFNVSLRQSRLGSVLLRMPGQHNIANALAAVAVGLELDIPFPSISEGLSQFTGISRRLEKRGEVNGIVFVDDYAHHPTEISATLETVKAMWGGRVVAVFQPHRYSRTQALWERLGRSFYDADSVIVTSIYAAGEQPIPGVTAESVAKAALTSGHRHVVYMPDREAITEHLAGSLEPGDVVITLGAGDIWKTGDDTMRRLAGD